METGVEVEVAVAEVAVAVVSQTRLHSPLR